MDKKEFLNKMIQIAQEYSDDPECSHVVMDNLMCELLKQLGYEDGVKIFETTEKWCS